MLIDSFTPDWLDDLDARAEAYERSGQTLLLLDGAFIPGIHNRIAKALPADEQLNFLFQPLPGWRDAVRDVSPFIFQFDRTNSWLKRVLNECSGWPMITAIETHEPMDAFSQRLSRWCVVQAAGQYINLRFPDTRRLADIYRVMTDDQRADLFGPSEHCAYINREGMWAHIRLKNEALPQNLQPELTADQFNELLNCSEGDSLLAQLDWHLTNATGVTRSTQYRTVCTAIVFGKSQNLDRNDLFRWCDFNLKHVSSKHDLPHLFATWQAEKTSNQVG